MPLHERAVKPLTERQIEVVKLLAEELTSKEIAERLNITLKTVIFHRLRIKQALGVKGTAGIVRWAIRNGVIEA